MKPFFTFLFIASFLTVSAQPGTLDYTFGDSGKVVSTSYQNSPNTSVLQPDGKILVGGIAGGYYRDGALITGVLIARYNKDGSLDLSFGDSGRAVHTYGENYGKVVYGLALQKDGKIVAAVRGFKNRFLLGVVSIVRLNEDGSIDESFGTDGRAFSAEQYTDDGDYSGADIAILPDNRIVVVGNYSYGENGNHVPFLNCFTPDGFLDNNFGDGGTVIFPDAAFPSVVSSMVLTKEGKIILGGNYSVGNYKTLLYRYNPDGTRDNTFGKNGVAEMPFERRTTSPTVTDIAIAAGNTIAAVGYASPNNAVYYSFMASRFLENGTPDSSFGTYGYTITPYSKENCAFNAVAVQSDGKLIAAGGSLIRQMGAFTTIRYDGDGGVDSSFGENGIIRTEFVKEGVTTSTATSALIQRDGKIVLCGQGSTKTFESYTTLARYNNDISRRQQIITRIRHWLQHHGITWQGDNNVRYYTVQRSLDGGVTYQPVAKLYNNHQSIVTYAEATANNNALYRVSAAAKDGSRSLSNPIALTNEASVKLFPNPVRSTLQLQGLPTGNKSSITVTDFSGNVRTSATARGGSLSINTASLKPGNYLLKVQSGNAVTTQTFVKE